jgi:predicted MPP superfamily phosphohydrolase
MMNTDSEALYRTLQQRVGRAHLVHRLYEQTHWVNHVVGHGLTYFHIENMLWLHWLIRLGLRLTGLYGRGRRNALRTTVRRNRVEITGLAPAFDGFTILHLSDLHLDINPDMAGAIAAAVAPLEYDLCVITGDYRSRTHGPHTPVLEAMARLRPVLRGDVYAVLGNHDFIEMVPPLEEMGYRLLMNESVMVTRGESALCVAGVDDPHFYETDNVQKAAGHLEHGVPSVLLAHSPEIYRKAAACGFDLLLCGHTHGGQICLPGGVPVIINARVPLRMVKHAWRYRRLQGYTSAGAGSSGLDVRFWCPPEVTLHTLVPAPRE